MKRFIPTIISIILFALLFSSVGCNRGKIPNEKSLNEKMYNEQIEQTLSNYIKYMRFDDVEKHEFLNQLCDTINSLYYPVFFRYPKRLMGMMLKVYFILVKKGQMNIMIWF